MEFITTKFLVILILATVTSATDYCNICPNHVACHNNNQFQSTCPSDAKLVQMSSSAIQTFLNTHNANRNKIAGGGEPGFKTAKKMMAVVAIINLNLIKTLRTSYFQRWDHELAYLAELNVKKCQMQHDDCIKTDQFPVAGQNLYWMGSSTYDNDVNKILANAVNSWYSEIKDASQADIDRCCGNNIGHFTQVVRDNVFAIGCAASRYTDGQWKSTLVACNYSYGNMQNTPVYVTGSTASACSKGRDSTYSNLCKN